ncbi:small multidrug export protein [Flavonifractor sp. An82]|nr:small multidrug export protein [Flavonifractor sp. An82]
MAPIIELRGGVPFGTALGLAPGQALIAAIVGNMLPIPFIIVYIRRIFYWMRRKSPRLNGLVDKLERKAHLKGEKVSKYKYIGLWLFVAIPLPGTGAWTGALAAAFLDMPLRKALPSIFLGVATAGLIMTFATGVVVSTVGG